MLDRYGYRYNEKVEKLMHRNGDGDRTELQPLLCRSPSFLKTCKTKYICGTSEVVVVVANAAVVQQDRKTKRNLS